VIPKSRGLAIVVAAFAAGAAGLALPAVALAEGTDVQQLGQQGKLVDGGNVSGWTVGALKPSSDVIPFTPRGTLWEATATEEAIAGGAQPFIPDFSARAANGETYHVLFQVPSAQGVNPSGLGQGQSVTGKLYFDVTGASPDSVVYGSRLTWVQPPPGAATDGAAPTWNGGAGQNTYTAPQTGSAAASAGASGAEAAAGTGNSPAAASTPETQTAPAQSTPSTAAAPETQTAPAQSTPATAAAPDDVQGSATPAQPAPTAAPLPCRRRHRRRRLARDLPLPRRHPHPRVHLHLLQLPALRRPLRRRHRRQPRRPWFPHPRRQRAADAQGS
jgi:hypothetical protein